MKKQVENMVDQEAPESKTILLKTTKDGIEIWKSIYYVSNIKVVPDYSFLGKLFNETTFRHVGWIEKYRIFLICGSRSTEITQELIENSNTNILKRSLNMFRREIKKGD